jgi:Tfp pilus assembly protein PilX
MIFRHYNKGIALFVSLSLLFLLSVGAIVVLLTAYNYTNVTENQIKRLQAISAAEAGINYVYWKLGPKTDDTGYAAAHTGEENADTIPGGSNTINGYKVKIWIEGPFSGTYTVKSKVVY